MKPSEVMLYAAKRVRDRPYAFILAYRQHDSEDLNIAKEQIASALELVAAQMAKEEAEAMSG